MEVKKLLFKTIIKEKPNFILFSFLPVEIDIGAIKKIKKISPKTKTIILFADDDIEFEPYSRYCALFFDYFLVCQTEYMPLYEKEKIKGGFPILGTNTERYQYLNLEKKYDVSFIGSALLNRRERLKFLIDKGIKINIWGKGWNNYPEFKNYYGGFLNLNDYVKVINQTKINLSFSKNRFGEPHFKGRVMELSACKAFQLVDYFSDYLKFFKEGKEIIMFKNKEDLFKKIKYYLGHNQKREEIVENSYKKTIAKFNILNYYKRFFKKIFDEENNFSKELPDLKKKIICLFKEDFKNINNLKEKIKEVDYISFSDKNGRFLEYKEFIQTYSLNLLKKPISCCDYKVFSKNLGYYLWFQVDKSFNSIPEKEFNKLLNINQLMVNIDFFVDNIEKFGKIFQGKTIDFLNEKNTAFVSIPLIEIKKFNKVSYQSMCKSFQMNFIANLYSLTKRKKLMFNKYFYKLVLESILNRNFFIFWYLFDSIFSKENWYRIKINN